jgi:hypothetical protein
LGRIVLPVTSEGLYSGRKFRERLPYFAAAALKAFTASSSLWKVPKSSVTLLTVILERQPVRRVFHETPRYLERLFDCFCFCIVRFQKEKETRANRMICPRLLGLL